MFVTFEGLDGSGKSTQIRLLADYLQQSGRRVCCTREPGGTRIGNAIRQVLHDVHHTEMTAEAEILLYSASRAQLVREVILPALAQQTWVLCDRYIHSTYAYQGYGRQLDFAELAKLTEFATQGLQPDLIIYLDLPIEVGLQRKAAAAATLNRMDRQTVAFYQRVREGYLSMAQADPNRWFIIKADQSVATIQQAVQTKIWSMLQTPVG